MTSLKVTISPQQFESLAEYMAEAAAERRAKSKKPNADAGAKYSAEDLMKYFNEGAFEKFLKGELKDIQKFIKANLDIPTLTDTDLEDKFRALYERSRFQSSGDSAVIAGDIAGDAINETAEAAPQGTVGTADAIPQAPAPAFISAASQEEGSYPPYSPHISITINGFDKPSSAKIASPAAAEPSLKDKAGKFVSRVASAAMPGVGDTPSSKTSSVDLEPSSDAYYIIAIGGLAGLIIGFIIACVNIDLQALISAPLGATMISAEGVLLKAYFNKRQRERAARKERIRMDLVELCKDDNVKVFLEIVAKCRIPPLGKECKKCPPNGGRCKVGEKECELRIKNEASVILSGDNDKKLSMKNIREGDLYFPAGETCIGSRKMKLREACRDAITRFHLKWVHYQKRDRVLIKEVLREASKEIDDINELEDLGLLRMSYLRQLETFFEFVDFVNEIHYGKPSRAGKLRGLLGLAVKAPKDHKPQTAEAPVESSNAKPARATTTTDPADTTTERDTAASVDGALPGSVTEVPSGSSRLPGE
ncbi:hypothetical protein HDU89_007833 [Geranomyces variabilis]|nr:hypothetical protein HDU89_007833 [Geranomyces variabilis]